VQKHPQTKAARHIDRLVLTEVIDQQDLVDNIPRDFGYRSFERARCVIRWEHYRYSFAR